jgi:recombination protein RecT
VAEDRGADDARKLTDAASNGELETIHAKGLLDYVKKQTSSIALALPNSMDPDRFVRIVQNELQKNPQLKECTPRSFMGAVITGAQLGLEPGPMQQWYPIPFRNHGTMECQFIVGYRGWAALAHRSGVIQGINPRTVFEGDEFRYEYGLDENIIHVPADDDKQGDPTHYYVVVRTTNGGRNFVVMTRQAVERHRDRYGKKGGRLVGPWADKDQFETMAWKTCFLKMKAWLPTSVDIMQADSVDGRVVNRLTVDEEPVVDDFDDGEVIDGELLDPNGNPIVEGETAWDREEREERERREQQGL